MSAAQTILNLLRERERPATVADLVAASGLHENAVRRNLARLIEQEQVSAEPQRSSGRGRPTLRYRAAGPAGEPYRELMPLLLALLGGAQPGEEAAFAAGRAHGLRTAPGGDAREAVISSLTTLGFAPRPIAAGAGAPKSATAPPTRVSLERCPFADLVTGPGGRQLCALHHGLLSGVAEARGGRVSDFRMVDPNRARCVLSLDEDAPAPAPDS